MKFLTRKRINRNKSKNNGAEKMFGWFIVQKKVSLALEFFNKKFTVESLFKTSGSNPRKMTIPTRHSKKLYKMLY